jgi:hypothetical protein
MALGSCSIQKICHLLAASERISKMRSSSADFRPTMVFTMSGKNATNAALTTFDVSPNPNQTMMSGANATFGIAWNMTMKGYRKYSSRLLSATIIPNMKAKQQPSANPMKVSASVTPIWSM